MQDDKLKELMALVLNACDASEYQQFNKAYALRKAIETKLRELVQPQKINGYESGMQSGSKVTLWFESPDAAEAWFDNFMENFKV